MLNSLLKIHSEHCFGSHQGNPLFQLESNTTEGTRLEFDHRTGGSSEVCFNRGGHRLLLGGVD